MSDDPPLTTAVFLQKLSDAMEQQKQNLVVAMQQQQQNFDVAMHVAMQQQNRNLSAKIDELAQKIDDMKVLIRPATRKLPDYKNVRKKPNTVGFPIFTSDHWLVAPLPKGVHFHRPNEYELLRKALDSILEQGEGSLLVTGQPGIGKTTMFDMLLHGYLSVQDPGDAPSPARVEYSTTHFDYPVLIVLVNEIHIIVPRKDEWQDVEEEAAPRQPTKYIKVRKFAHYVANVGKSAIDAPEFQRQLDETLNRHTAAPPPGEKRQLLVLHDVKSQQSLPFHAGLMESLQEKYKLTLVVAASPDDSNTKEFTKSFPNHQTFVMAPLTEDESYWYMNEFVAKEERKPFRDLTKLLGLKMLTDLNTANWRNQMKLRYLAVGGVPRHLQTRTSVAERLQLQQKKIWEIGYVGNFNPSINYKSSNAIVCVLPTGDRQDEKIFVFLSDSSCALWWRHVQEQQHWKNCLDRWKTLALNTQTGGVEGYLYEHCIRGMFCEEDFHNWKFVLRLLPSANANAPATLRALPATLRALPATLPFSMKTANAVRHNNNCDQIVAGKDKLCVPISCNFPLTDFMYLEEANGLCFATLIQVTVAESHNPTANQFKDLSTILESKNITIKQIVWVVRIHNATNFKRQKLVKVNADNRSVEVEYDNVPQYMCTIDCNRCWVQQTTTARTKTPPTAPTTPEEEAFCIAVGSFDESDIKTALKEIYPDAELHGKQVEQAGVSPTKPIKFTRPAPQPPVPIPPVLGHSNKKPMNRVTGAKRLRSVSPGN
jgi:hypothetical protein